LQAVKADIQVALKLYIDAGRIIRGMTGFDRIHGSNGELKPQTAKQ